jgi:hypothetical protein
MLVPDNCEYAIFHGLDVAPALTEKPRRWGKTHILTTRAIELAKKGQEVFFLVRTLDMRDNIKWRIQSWGFGHLLPLIHIVSMIQVKNGKMRGMKGIPILVDEIRSHELDELEQHFGRNYFLEGYVTPW